MKPMTRLIVTTVLDLLGVAALVAFAALLWWPAVLPVVALACLAASWKLTA